MSKQRARGTDFETSLIPILQAYYPDAHRLGLQGAKDKGDFFLGSGADFVIEAKNYSSYAGKLAGWLKEAEIEAGHAGKTFGVVAHKRHGTRVPAFQFVTCTLQTFLELVANG